LKPEGSITVIILVSRSATSGKRVWNSEYGISYLLCITRISCCRLMTLTTDNLTKGNRKNIESALIGGQLNAMVRHFI